MPAVIAEFEDKAVCTRGWVTVAEIGFYFPGSDVQRDHEVNPSARREGPRREAASADCFGNRGAVYQIRQHGAHVLGSGETSSRPGSAFVQVTEPIGSIPIGGSQLESIIRT